MDKTVTTKDAPRVEKCPKCGGTYLLGGYPNGTQCQNRKCLFVIPALHGGGHGSSR